MKAIPLVVGRQPSKAEAASSPPAEAPIATIGIGRGGPRAGRAGIASGLGARAVGSLSLLLCSIADSLDFCLISGL
jgi:hypothetical protein